MARHSLPLTPTRTLSLRLATDPQIPESRPAPPRFGRENGRDFPDPDWAGIGKILGILPRSRFGRDPGKSGNPDLAGIGEKAGICASIKIRIGIGTQDLTLTRSLPPSFVLFYVNFSKRNFWARAQPIRVLPEPPSCIVLRNFATFRLLPLECARRIGGSGTDMWR